MSDDFDTDNDPNTVEDIHEAPKHRAIENILAWIGLDDKTWLAHVINADKPCGCQIGQEGFEDQFCEAYQARMNEAATRAERKLAAGQ